MSYVLATLFYERSRYLPGILAVAFSAILIAMQGGLLLGLLSLTSIPVDNSPADLWVGHPKVLSVDLGRPIPERLLTQIAAQPEVTRAEVYLLNLLLIDRPGVGSEVCTIIGVRLDDESCGAVRQITPRLRALLAEPGAVVVDEADMGRLGITEVGQLAEVMGRRVRVVGTIRENRSLACPYVFCSVETARSLFFHTTAGQCTYIVARTRTVQDAERVAARFQGDKEMAVYTKSQFSERTRWHWLTATKSGIAVGWAAVLGLLVGAAVTSQTLYAATAAAMREFAVLRALGIPRWRIAVAVINQSFWVGAIGVGLALPFVSGMSWLIEYVGGRMLLPWWLLASMAGITMSMAVLSGLAALRSLRLTEPVELLR